MYPEPQQWDASIQGLPSLGEERPLFHSLCYNGCPGGTDEAYPSSGPPVPGAAQWNGSNLLAPATFQNFYPLTSTSPPSPSQLTSDSGLARGLDRARVICSKSNLVRICSKIRCLHVSNTDISGQIIHLQL